MIYDMTARIESASRTRTIRTRCYGEETLQSERNHWRQMCSQGGTITFKVKRVV